MLDISFIKTILEIARGLCFLQTNFSCKEVNLLSKVLLCIPKHDVYLLPDT